MVYYNSQGEYDRLDLYDVELDEADKCDENDPAILYFETFEDTVSHLVEVASVAGFVDDLKALIECSNGLGFFYVFGKCMECDTHQESFVSCTEENEDGGLLFNGIECRSCHEMKVVPITFREAGIDL